MTALCGGVSSSPKLGYAAVVDVSAGAIALYLDKYGAGVLMPIIPLLSLPSLVLSTFCASDPPAIPTFTTAETTAMLGLQFGADFDSGLSKLRDLVLHYVWLEVCQCSSGTPTLPAPFTPPANTPSLILPPVTAGTICAVDDASHPESAIVSGAGLIAGFGWNDPSDTQFGISPTALRVEAWRTPIGAGPHETTNVRIRERDATEEDVGGGVDTVLGTIPANGVHYTFTKTFAPGTVAVIIFLDSVSTSTDTEAVIASLLCGPVTTLTPGCCPPDPLAQVMLQQVLSTVTLLQRQLAPFAHVNGTVHSGLSGSGVLSISGLLGAKVDVTTLPSSYGRSGTTPTEYFDLGFLTFGDADSYPSSYRLDRASLLMLPVRCSAYTQLAYDLSPGVVVTVTELLREP